MDRTFNFRQSQELLQVDPKTFSRWLEKAHIDPSKQVNRADPRQKWLTEEQILLLAKEHGRDVQLPPADQEDEPEPRPAAILTTVDERLFALEQKVTHRFDQLDARMEHVLAELQRIRVSASPQNLPTAPAPRARNAAPSASASTTPSTRTAAPPKPTAKKRGKRKAKARKLLPGTLTPLATFRQAHGISEKAVEIAVQRNKLAVVRGEWVYEHRPIGIALDRQGEQQFVALFGERQEFQRCGDCPHAV
jgi:hypothetical protein